MVLSHSTGDWDKARDASDQGLTVSPQEFRHLLGRCLLELELGNFDEAREYLDRVQEGMRHVPPGPTLAHSIVAALAPVFRHISGQDPGLDIAQQAERVVLTSPSLTPTVGVWTRVGPSLTAVQQGDSSTAKEQYEAAVDAPGKQSSIFAGVTFHRLLGLLAQTMGEPDKAAGHFEDSLTYCRNAGYRPELAWTCHDYADLLLARPDDPSTSSGRTDGGDRAKATSLLDESLAISSELGMRPLMERALSRRQILGA